MYKQTLCVPIPISAAVIIAVALFANAGDLDPPKGPIEPTMHTLQEIYDLVQQSSPCGGCTWEYVSFSLSPSQEVLAVEGSGVLHGIWLSKNGAGTDPFQVWNGIPADNDRIGAFRVLGESLFFQLDVTFESSLYLRAGNHAVEGNILYRTTK